MAVCCTNQTYAIPLQFIITPYSNCNFGLNCNSCNLGTPCYNTVCPSNPCCGTSCTPNPCGFTPTLCTPPNAQCANVNGPPPYDPYYPNAPPFVSFSPYGSNYSCSLPCQYLLNLTLVENNQYTFVITSNSNNCTSKQVAQGNATLICNYLVLCFLDENEASLGEGVIQFINYNFYRQGTLQTTGNISTNLFCGTFLVSANIQTCVRTNYCGPLSC